MTPDDKKKAQFLAVLVVFGALVFYWVYRGNPLTSTVDTQTTQTAKHPAPVRVSEPRIRLDLLAESRSETEVGRKNLFQYRQAPAPPRPSAPPAVVSAPPPSQTTVRMQPPAPLPPPFKAFRYEGFSVRGDPKTGQRMASLSEGGNIYHVIEGERLMEYLVARITETTVEIVDTATNQRRSFARVQP